MPKTVRVPEPFAPLFDQAEGYLEAFFAQLKREPSKGTIHIGDQRYILARGESLFLALYDQLKGSFGDEAAYEFIYNFARVIGRSDCEAFSRDRRITDPTAKLSTGPVHFAYTGWAFVDIYPTSQPSPDNNYFLHYEHPNTFEAEVYKKRGDKAEQPICFFSAGYSAGWCSAAYGIDVHAREVRCTAAGDSRCEFIMAPFARLDTYEADIKAKKP